MTTLALIEFGFKNPKFVKLQIIIGNNVFLNYMI